MAVATPVENQLSELLEHLGASLDISDELYAAAVTRYKEVGTFLEAPESVLRAYVPRIYPQGSFRLGTMVRPWLREDEYDIDLVCVLRLEKSQVTQAALKKMVGHRLAESREYAAALRELGRCWQLQFSRQFHLDVLPCIPDTAIGGTCILLTDKDLLRWQHSNPIGYADWFDARMKDVMAERRLDLALRLNRRVEDVPLWRIRTPLQRVVQVLKRHRDIYFQDDCDNKPASILITTLAGYAYTGQRDILEALMRIARDLRAVEVRNGVDWVPNPANPQENFADKWRAYPERKTKFMSWVSAVEDDIRRFQAARGLDRVVHLMNPVFGQRTSEAAIERYGRAMLSEREQGRLLMTSGSGRLVTGSAATAAGAVTVPRHTFFGR